MDTVKSQEFSSLPLHFPALLLGRILGIILANGLLVKAKCVNTAVEKSGHESIFV
jgi:hypothetical protein